MRGVVLHRLVQIRPIGDTPHPAARPPPPVRSYYFPLSLNFSAEIPLFFKVFSW